MKQNYSIFVSIALVAATMFFCGKNVDFLLYTLLGRSIIVLSIIGLTIFNKYVGIIATIFVTTLYNISDYKEGFTGENGDETENELGNPEPSLNAPYGAGTSSSPAEIAQEEDDDDDYDDVKAEIKLKAENEAELTTIGQGPLDQSNTLI
jgi:hypothetical protein